MTLSLFGRRSEEAYDMFDGLPEFDLFGECPDPPNPADPDGLRWHQRECCDRVTEELRTVNTTLAVMATGAGKTETFCALAKHVDGDVLVLSPKIELVDQARARLERMIGAYVEVEQAEYKASHNARYVSGSVMSVGQQKRLERFGKKRFAHIFVDEAHHAVSAIYRRILDWFDCPKSGWTATPDRTDEVALGQVFDSVAYVLDIEDMIDTGFGVPVRARQVTVTEIDLTKVNTAKDGDFVQSQLDDAMIGAVEGIVQKTLELEPGRQGIAFFPGVRSAEYAAERFNKLRPGSAVFICGETDRYVRKQYVDDFKRGKFQYLCNCDVATEGFDAPPASLIVHGAPSKSRAKYAQRCGRGTRVLPGVVDHLPRKDQAEERRRLIAGSAKPDCMVLDFVGVTESHSLCSVEDILGGKYTEAEVELAKKKRERGELRDGREGLAAARREMLAMASRVKAARVEAVVSDVDPFKMMGVSVREQDRYADRFGTKPVTENQARLLKSKGVPDNVLKTLSFRAASRLIDKCIERQKQGLATYKQLRLLQKYGVNDPNVLFERARAALTYVESKGYGRTGQIDPKELNAIVYYQREPGE